MRRIAFVTRCFIRTRRQEFAKDPAQVMHILEEGTKVARAAAAQTFKEVRQAMRIDYFGTEVIMVLKAMLTEANKKTALQPVSAIVK